MDILRLLDIAHQGLETQPGQYVLGGLLLTGLLATLRQLRLTVGWLLRGGFGEWLLGLFDRSSRRGGLL